MLVKKTFEEINRLGVYGFFQLKYGEKITTQKFTNFGVYYPANNTDHNVKAFHSINDDYKINQASSYFIIKKGLKKTNLKYSQISLLDIGCGYGRVLNFAMFLHCKNVIGIDLDRFAVHTALFNCLQMKNAGYDTLYGVYHEDASNFNIPEHVNTIYMFNPFGRQTMTDVMVNIVRFVNLYKKEIYIVYSKPVHADVFISHVNCELIFPRVNKPGIEVMVFKIRFSDEIKITK